MAALQTLISGVSEGGLFELPFNNPEVLEKLTNIARSMESLFWLMPREPIWRGETIVSTPSYEYSAREYKKLFSALPEGTFGNAYKKFQQAIGLGSDFPAPNVRTYCMYGIGNDCNTPECLEYSKDFSNNWDPTGETPKVILGLGDGVVNKKNAEVCLDWKDMSQGFQSHVCYGFPHKEGCGEETMDKVKEFAKTEKTPRESKDSKEKILKEAIKESIMEVLEEEITTENELEKMLMKLME